MSAQQWVVPFAVTWGLDPSYDRTLLEWAIAAQVFLASRWIQLHPETPSPIGFVAYAHDDQNDFALDVPTMLATRVGDCKDIVSWRIAWLRARGEPARFQLQRQGYANGTHRYHVVTVRANGAIEDTARLCGMP